MLSSKQKVNKALFKTLMEKGRNYHSAGFSLRVFFDSKQTLAKFSVVVPKKIEKSAVKRNGIKRRVYDVVGSFLKNAVPASVSAIFIKVPINRSSLPDFRRELEMAFKKSGIIA